MKIGAETKLFLNASEKVGFDKEHRKKIKFNISKYNTAVNQGKKLYKNLELAKERAAYIKYKVVNDLDNYLIEFEDNYIKNGGKIIWAREANEAVKEILKLVKSKKAKTFEIYIKNRRVYAMSIQYMCFVTSQLFIARLSSCMLSNEISCKF